MLNRLAARIAHAEPRAPWTIWNAISGVAILFFAVLLCTALALVLLGDGQFTILLSWSMAALIALVALYANYRVPEKRAALRIDRVSEYPSSLSPLQSTLLLLLIGVGLAITLDIITRRVTSLPRPEPELWRLYTDVTLYGKPVLFISWAAALVFMVVLQPLIEAVIFQGLLLPSLRQALGSWPGYLLSGVIYGLFHMMVYAQPPTAFAEWWYFLLTPLLAGLIFGAVRLYTGSTRAAALTHVAFGLFALVKLLTLVG